MAYVLNTAANGPATHALVIGVGKYTPNDWNLPDLDSAILSAEAFAQWLLDPVAGYSNPAKLASLEVVWSPVGAPQDFIDATGQRIAIEAATMANVSAAVKRWFALCDASFDNIGILYFCGHGYVKGLSNILLLEGFAQGGLTLGDDAVDLSVFTEGMERCAARKQIYFIDACQTTPAAALQTPIPSARPLVEPDYSKTKTLLPRHWPIFYATSERQEAFGEVGRVSRYTAALLLALKGAGWDDRTNPWNEWLVQTDSLTSYINQLLDYEEEVRNTPSQVATRGGKDPGFVLHVPPAGAMPHVPLFIDYQSNGARSQAHFAVNQNGMMRAQTAAPVDVFEQHLPAAPDYIINILAGAMANQHRLVLRPACKIAHL